MSLEENKALARRAYEAFTKGDLAALDQYMSTDVIDHNPGPNQAPGLQGVKDFIKVYRYAFENLRFTVEQQVAEGDLVVSRVVYSGRHTKEFMGIPPTGREMSGTGMDMLRISNGKIVERWGNEDSLKMLQDLGVIPAMGGQQRQAA